MNQLAVQRSSTWILCIAAIALCAALPVSVGVGKVALLVGAAAWLLGGGHRHPLGLIIALGAAQFAWLQASEAIVAAGTGGTWGTRSGITYTWLAFPVVAAATADPRVRRWALRLLIAGLLASTLLAILQAIIGHDPAVKIWRLSSTSTGHTRPSGFFGHHLSYASVVAMVALVMATPALRAELAWPWRLGILAAGVIGCVISGSRATILALAAGGAALLSMGRSRAWLRLLGWGAFTAVLALGALWMVQPDYLEEMIEMRTGRWWIWDASWQVFSAHPLTGAGGEARYTAATHAIYPSEPPGMNPEWWFAAGAPHAHNSYLHLLATWGLPALLIHVALILACVRSVGRLAPAAREARGAAWTLAAFVAVLALFDHATGKAETAAAFFALLGVLANAGRGQTTVATNEPK